jgi:CzcA family heavy metal efflux pump
LRALIALALRYRLALALLTPLLLLLGTLLALRAPLDVFPEFVTPQIVIQTEAEGLAPEQVEALITRPIENAVNGTPGLASLRSNSIAGLSVVTLVLTDDYDVRQARQAVAEKLAPLTGQLPQGAKPSLEPLTSSTMDLLSIGLVSDTLSPMALRDYADWQLRPRLLAVAGVARVTVYGGEQRQLQIEADPQRLLAHDLTLDDLATAAQSATGIVGAGTIDTGAQQITLALTHDDTPLSALANVVVARSGGVSVRLRDVADVRFGAAPKIGEAVIQGRPGVLLTASAQYGANTLETTLRVEQALAEIAPSLRGQGIRLYPALHRPANFIESSLTNLRDALLLGTVLILLVLYAFLRDWRSALISFLAIPLSLIAAILVLKWQGISLNTMTLGGFAVALGVLVDDAIIGLENILRRLRENNALPEPRAKLAVVLDASMEIRSAVFYATVVVLVVFLPVWLLGGIQGHFLAPMAEAFALSVLASLVVAMVFTPAFAALALNAHALHAESQWIMKLRAWQGRVIGTIAAWPRSVLAALMVMLALAGIGLARSEGEFLPMFREGHFVLQVSGLSGTSIEEMRRIGEHISADVLKLPEVATINQQIGRAEAGEDTWGPERSEFHVELKPDRNINQVAVQEKLRALLAGYPGLRSEVMTFLGDRISESISGETAQGVVTVYGEDLDRLQQDADAIVRALTSIPGLREVQAARLGGAPMLTIGLDSEALARAGLAPEQVQRAVSAAYAGERVAQAYEGERVIDIVLTVPPAWRRDPASVGRLLIKSPNHGYLPLSSVARIEDNDGRTTIAHEGGHRRAVVTYNLQGISAGEAMRAARDAIATKVKLAAGSHVEFSGVAESERQTRISLAVDTALVLVLVLLCLNAAFDQKRHAGWVLANLPFALLGGALAIVTTGIGLSLGALVGLVTVFGMSNTWSLTKARQRTPACMYAPRRNAWYRC